MKKLILSILFVLASIGVFAQENFGKKINEKGAIPVTELSTKMGKKEAMNVKVSGKVDEVCQAKGCWMTVVTAEGQTMRVRFKDYGFFVPKDISGKTVVFEGEAKVKTTSVAELRHYAEDAKKSPEEIAKITEPKHELTFVADGVIVKN